MKTSIKSAALFRRGLVLCTLLAAPLAQSDGLSFIASRDLEAGQAPQFVSVGDFNGDGVQDIAVASSGSNDVSVLLGDGDGDFQAASTLLAP